MEGLHKKILTRLSSLRYEHGYSQAQIAKELCIEPSTYQKMEKGDTTSWSIYLEKILKIYNITDEEFFSQIYSKNFIHKKNEDNSIVFKDLYPTYNFPKEIM